MWKLVVIEGPNRGAVIEVRPGGNRIGRDPDGEVVLPDRHVSRSHARIDLDIEGDALLHDLGSRNATAVNGVRMSAPRRLSSGDELRLGDTTLLMLEDRAAPPGERDEETEPVLQRQAPGAPGPAAPADDLDPAVVAASRAHALTATRYLIGESPALRQVAEFVARCAAIDTTVLITGESGSGKELVAEALHRHGSRRDRPFVAVNCATLEPALLESELFGHERGAFTGAVARKLGLLQLARGGTFFLDEVGELPLGAQAKLLRVVERKQFQRLGGQEPITTDARIVAATHRDLAALVREGKFREDLLFRLRVAEIQIPPLRERPEDLAPLVEHFLAELRLKIPTRVDGLTPEALEALRCYRFPGNVRELRNIVERCLIFCPVKKIRLEDLPLEVRGAGGGASGAAPTPASGVPVSAARAPARPAAVLDVGPASTAGALLEGQTSLEDVERRHIEQVLAATGWNKTRAAHLLGIDRATLYAKIKQFSLGPQAASSAGAGTGDETA